MIDCHTTAQVATLRSAEHEVSLQTQHIDGPFVALGFKVSVIFQANNNVTIIITTISTSVSGAGGGIVG